MNSDMRVNKSLGLTLIELVIVVVILGFLTVTVIPKLLDLKEQAKKINIEGIAGSFATGISLTRAKWVAEGRPNNGLQNSVDYNNSTFILTSENKIENIQAGYVTGITDGENLDQIFDAANCVEIWINILHNPPSIMVSLASLNDKHSISYRYYASKSGTFSSSRCHFYLKESLERSENGDYIDPEMSTEVGNSFTYQPSNSSVIVYVQDVEP
jgi:MSHA pilin protein MshB